MRNYRAFLPLLLAPLALGLGSRPATAIQFTSTLSSIKVQARPGERVQRTFELHLPAGQPAVHFQTKVEDWWQSVDGKQSFYRPVGTVPRSCGPWASLDPLDTMVPGGGTLRVRVSLAVPGTAPAGGYWCVLTVNEVPDPLAAPQGVAVQFLSSISVGVFVYLAPVERAVRVEAVEVGTDQASIRVTNQGNTPLAVEGRLEFVLPGAAVPTAAIVLPRSTLLLDPAPERTISVPLPDVVTLPSGHYLVRAILDIGLDHFLGVQRELEVQRARPAGHQQGG